MKASEVNSRIAPKCATEKLIDAERIEPLEALAKAREPRRRDWSAQKNSFGVGSNVNTSDELPPRSAAAWARVEDRPMADVQAVEHADGHGALLAGCRSRAKRMFDRAAYDLTPRVACATRPRAARTR